MNAPGWQRGLYLVTPDEPDTARLLARVSAVLGEASLLQYRNKAASPGLRSEQALALLPLCRGSGVPLIVNDDIDLAHAIGAAGVHLGEGDGAIQRARATLGETAIIGASCYDDLRRAHAAAQAGASYIAFGAFFPSTTKPGARRAAPSLLRDAGSLRLPRVAIGGITPANARVVIDAGAELVAVIAGVFDATDPAAAARAYRLAFARAATPA